MTKSRIMKNSNGKQREKQAAGQRGLTKYSEQGEADL